MLAGLKVTRLFAFGCSFTAYHYPTWADIAGTAFDTFENWGKPSSGNNYILNSLIECTLTNQLNSNDTVYIMWSGISRRDYYLKNEWLTKHNDYGKYQNCIRGDEIQSYSYMAAAQHVLENIGCAYQMFTFLDWEPDPDIKFLYSGVLDSVKVWNYSNTRDYSHTEYDNIFELEEIKLNYQRLAGSNWPSYANYVAGTYTVNPDIQQELDGFSKGLKLFKSTVIDDHPSPATHLKLVEKYLSHLNISSQTKCYIEQVDQSLFEHKKYNFTGSRPRQRL